MRVKSSRIDPASIEGTEIFIGKPLMAFVTARWLVTDEGTITMRRDPVKTRVFLDSESQMPRLPIGAIN